MNDVTEQVLDEARGCFTLRSAPASVQKALQGRPPRGKLSATETTVLAKIGIGQELGPWAHIVIYNDVLTYASKLACAAFIRLLRRGCLRVVRGAPEPDGKYAARQFTYRVVPA